MASLDMDKPIPLVEMKDDKLQLNPEAVCLLSNNQAPATVISIVGKLSIFVFHTSCLHAC